MGSGFHNDGFKSTWKTNVERRYEPGFAKLETGTVRYLIVRLFTPNFEG